MNKAKEMINKQKFNPNEEITLSESEVESLMNEFAVHIAEQAVEEHMIDIDHPFISIQRETAKIILSRIKQLTESK